MRNPGFWIRTFSARVLGVVALLLPAGWCCASETDRPPNIIYIVADDLGYGELGCYTQKWIHTPHLDQLAREGMRFTQHYAGSSISAPSLCCLLTGKHSGHGSIRTNRMRKPLSDEQKSKDQWPGQWPLPDKEVTLAEMLKQQGYATAAIGKWGLGHFDNSGNPLHQGFDLFYGFLCKAHAHNHYPRFLWRNEVKQIQPGNDGLQVGQTYCQDQFTNTALRFIRENRDKPLFLYMPVTIPHPPIQVPDVSLDEYRDKIPEAPYKRRTGYAKHPTPRAGYAAMISHLDRDVGRIMTLLKELGLDKKTLVVFTSDGGPASRREGGTDSDFFNSSGNLRGRKGCLYEGGIRVPMIARWPGKIAPGSVTDRVSAFWDVLPTLAELTGAHVPAGIDGVSFAPTLLGRPEPPQKPRALYWEFPAYGGQQAVRIGRWKGIRRDILQQKKPGLPPLELYDLSNDPGEKNDVAQQHPETVARLEKIMKQEHTPNKSFPINPLDKSDSP